jgi:hypothetical protein
MWLPVRRRDLLVAAAALYAGGQMRRATAAATIDPGRFQSISVKLCGVGLDDLDFAKAIEAVLLSDTSSVDLASLLDLVEATPIASLDAAIARHGLDELADRLVALWYSGMTATPGDQRVLSFTSAAAWTATGYAKPPTYCAPRFGSWADRP